ncbi:hypothetical protein MMC28_010386 [Mycoblastus sanguinarius]|nr:hypothetical protein [Mycoblastus sanguinarius]
MSIAQSRQHPLPPPLSTSTDMGVSTLIHERGDVSYSNPSSSSTATRPSLSMPPTSVPDKAPTSTSTMDNGRIYSLDIRQQPIRARMCGFGDKDRRPITPPPCIRLVVKDAITRKEIDINEIDTSYFVLTVDLWQPDAQKEVNLVRHSATSPSISAATSTSYPPPVDEPPAYVNTPLQQVSIPPNLPQPPSQRTDVRQTINAYQQASATYHQHQFPQGNQNTFQQPATQSHPHSVSAPQQQQGYYTSSTGTPVTPTYHHGQGPLLSPSQLASCDPRSNPSGMFTRNLIGSLCVSAFKLTNPEGQMGVWFILQDLSVRTEGSFRHDSSDFSVFL